jgi:hypothetical protein
MLMPNSGSCLQTSSEKLNKLKENIELTFRNIIQSPGWIRTKIVIDNVNYTG